MRIYLDMCCYNRPYDDQSQIKIAMETQAKLYIQNLVDAGELELVGSFILDFECSQNPFEMRKRAILKFMHENIKIYVGQDCGAILTKKADEFMSIGIKEKDALHLASAVISGCDYFISTDIRLLKHKIGEIKMLTPIEFISETEAE